ncbi:hypothetical protein ACYF6T_31435 [Streptomyces sp. 7R007]
MRHRRLAARAAAATAALALLALGAGPALAGTSRPAPPAQYTAVDLGTLGGTMSSGIALDPDTVVGSSSLPGDTESHAFAYDRHTHVMTDLGTLGGTTSSTVAVQGRYVIGDSTTADGYERGFVYDLRTHYLRDLGTLGGFYSQVNAISGHTVVGSARTADQTTHAFVYDVRTHVMTDLGTPAGPAGSSSAVGISQGRFIAGTWTVPAAPYDGGHAFVYDLRTHTMTDLSAYGGTVSKATSISGHTVVGFTQDSGAPAHGFAYDIATRTWTDLGPETAYQPRVTGHTVVAGNRPAAYALDLVTGTLTPFGTGTTRTGINGVSGKYVAGDAYPGPFAYVYRLDTGALTELPALGGVHSTASGADRQGSVVGTSATTPSDPGASDGPYHATLWVPCSS